MFCGKTQDSAAEAHWLVCEGLVLFMRHGGFHVVSRRSPHRIPLFGRHSSSWAAVVCACVCVCGWQEGVRTGAGGL